MRVRILHGHKIVNYKVWRLCIGYGIYLLDLWRDGWRA